MQATTPQTDSLEVREDKLIFITDCALHGYIQWLGQEGLNYVTATLEQAIEDIVLLFRYGDIPAKMRDIDRVVDRLSTQWESYKNKVEVEADPQAAPPQELWVALDSLKRAREDVSEVKARRLESIQDLDKLSGIGDKQIAKMYGWFDDYGQPDERKVREERAEPGTHTIEDYLPPAIRHLGRVQEDQEEVLRRRGWRPSLKQGAKQVAKQRGNAEVVGLSPPAPEQDESEQDGFELDSNEPLETRILRLHRTEPSIRKVAEAAGCSWAKAKKVISQATAPNKPPADVPRGQGGAVLPEGVYVE